MIDKKMMQGPRTMAAFGGIMGKDGRKRFFLGGGGNDSYDIGGGGDPGNTTAPGGQDDPAPNQNNDNPFSTGYQGVIEQKKPIPLLKPEIPDAGGEDGNPFSTGYGGAYKFTDKAKKDKINFLNTPYEPVNLPSYIPYSPLINTAGNFLANLGHKKNKQFFADNVVGKYGYGYDDYKKYMSDRTSGLTNAYGRELNEGEIGYNYDMNPLVNPGGGNDNGIMSVYNPTDDTTNNPTDDTTTEDQLLLRFMGADRTLNPAAAGVANTDELRAMILERSKNLYT